MNKYEEFAEITRSSHRQKFNLAGVEYMDSNIVRKINGNKEITEKTILSEGSFFGQCIIEVFGGKWEEDCEGAYINFDNSTEKIYPLNIVRNYYEKGETYSIHNVFKYIPSQLNIQPKPKLKKKSWWKF